MCFYWESMRDRASRTVTKERPIHQDGLITENLEQASWLCESDTKYNLLTNGIYNVNPSPTPSCIWMSSCWEAWRYEGSDRDIQAGGSYGYRLWDKGFSRTLAYCCIPLLSLLLELHVSQIEVGGNKSHTVTTWKEIVLFMQNRFLIQWHCHLKTEVTIILLTWLTMNKLE